MKMFPMRMDLPAEARILEESGKVQGHGACRREAARRA